jgi:transcription termination/antitermination protein NusG
MFTQVRESWFALHVAPRHEKRVASVLSYKGYQQFFPTYQSRRKWSDRVKTLELPLFPGYVFCRIMHGIAAGLLLTTPGVIRVVGFGGKPYPVPDHEIDAIQKIALCPDIIPVPYLKVGQKVRICNGPLSGIAGMLTHIKNRRRLVVSVELIMRSIAVDVDAYDVRPISETEAGAA